MKCDRPTYSDLHRYVKNILNNRRFFCPLDKCEYSKLSFISKKATKGEAHGLTYDDMGLPYTQALDHQKTC
jgi:hypothetical protein